MHVGAGGFVKIFESTMRGGTIRRIGKSFPAGMSNFSNGIEHTVGGVNTFRLRPKESNTCFSALLIISEGPFCGN